MLRFIIALALATSTFAREEFPENELRQGYNRLYVSKIGSSFYDPELQVMSNGEFDAAKALASCDAIDKNLKESLSEKKKFVTTAKARWEKNDPSWDKALREELEFGGAAVEGVPLKQSIQAHYTQRWSCLYYSTMPCHDRDSFERVTALAEDPALFDDPIFNTCVRLVKILRKSGQCVSDQLNVDKACAQVKGKDVTTATVVDDGNKQTVQQTRDGKPVFEKTNLIGVDEAPATNFGAKPKIVIPRPTSDK